MALQPGTQIGPYEIVALLGAGGMGEVYRARDSKLKRDIAIKVLPDDFAREPDRMARFQREAQMLAALNHPNIAAIYGLEESDGACCLVLELVEGKTLAEVIAAGALPVEKAVTLALQIAEALEAAHDKGIIHRDLKPANVKVTPEGTVKVLDFGLAKAFGDESGAGSVDASLSPTLTLAATQAGLILGTAAYMSPEQAAGQPCDRRSDIWSFGAVLMEMFTGYRPFTGETVPHILASVLKEDPAWERLPADLPPRLVELLKACLHKQARHRLQAIGDARVLLEEYLADPQSFAPVAGPTLAALPAQPRWQRLLPWTVAGLLSVSLVGTAWTLWPQAPPPQVPRRLSIQTPGEETLYRGYGSSVVISPDGSRIAYVVGDGGRRNLYVQSLDQWQSTLLVAGGDAAGGPYNPFFSPDGEWVGFVTLTAMKKVPVRGGSPITLCEVARNRGASWGADGSIIFTPTAASGLFRVAATGGKPAPLTELDTEAGESTHRWPQVLPGGKAVLFTSNTGSGNFDSAHLELLVLDTAQRKVLTRGGSYGRYVNSGHVVYLNQGALFAFPFDLDTLEATGPAAPVIEGIAGDAVEGGAQFSVSAEGSLFYATGNAQTTDGPLVWVDRQGTATPLWNTPQDYGNPTLSPDGTLLAVDIEKEGNRDIWVYDLQRDVPTRLTFADGDDVSPVWSTDGEHLFFASDRDGAVLNLYRKASDGSGQAERLLESAQPSIPLSVSPDGKLMAYVRVDAGNIDIWLLPLAGGEPEPFVATPAVEYGAKFSPDGRWIVYGSNESGSFQIYVRPASGDRGKWQISTGDNVSYPHWSRGGGEIFFRNASSGVTSTAVETDGGALRTSRAEVLFEKPFRLRPGADHYAVAPDGNRFVMVETEAGTGPDATHEHIRVVLDWFTELRQTFAGTAESSR